MKLRSATTAPIVLPPRCAALKIAGVQPFDQRDARIGGERRIHLAMPDIDGDDMRRAALQKHLREAAGRGAEIERRQARRVEAERVERRRSASTPSARHSAPPGSSIADRLRRADHARRLRLGAAVDARPCRA